jgi:glycosyltransferase involved in cell wall biosynthesis
VNNKLLIYRKKRAEFNSIENVFNTLVPFLDTTKIELPFFSKGILPRLKNISFIKQRKGTLNHITGNDHYLALGLKKKTVILTIHDIEILKRTKGIKRLILKKIWFDWPIKKAKIVTTISEFTKSELIKLGNYKTPIIVVSNPLTLPIKYSPKEFNTNCPSILHLGVKPNKNLPRLISALNGIKCHLIIIGKENKETLELLSKHNITYSFKTNLCNEEVMEEYKKCDILSFISTYEGFGLPIVEAQAMGRPIITSNISSMPEVAADGALLIDPYNVEDIKNGILKIITNIDYRNSLIENGLKNIKRFEPQQIANQYNSIYKDVIDGQ